MGRNAILLLLLFGFFAGTPGRAQEVGQEGPMLEQELITLTRNTPLDQALRVIQTFSSRALVDPQHLETPIGVDIDRQPWRRALQMIAERNGLQVQERENYLELVLAGREAAAPGAAARVTSPDEVTLDSREVNISAIFFQADREAMRELGIDWSTLSGGRVDVSASHLGGGQVSSDQFSVGARANINRSVSLNVLLKTFESQNIGEIVANPQVKVRSGKSGYIQVGSDFSVFTSDFSGNTRAQFFSTGTILTVEPKIRTQEEMDFVDLDVSAERSSLIDPVRNLVSKTVARTSALLKNGEYTAIGGLYGQEVSVVRTGVPLLKDLPGWFFGLRYLFGHTSRRVSKTELIVLIKVDIIPSVRERMAEEARKGSEIIRERREVFEEILEDVGREQAEPDSLQR